MSSSKPSCDTTVRRVTWLGLILNVFLSGLKMAAGWFGHSQALIADGVHSMTDISSDLVILIGVRYWSQPADKDHPHGHRRIETLVTVVIGVILLLTALGLLLNAAKNLMEPTSIPGNIAAVAAFISVILKELLYHYTMKHSKKCRSMTLKANAWHHRTDALSSIPVLIAVVLIRWNPAWGFLDSIAAVLVVFFIIQAAWEILKPSIAKLIDTSASPEKVAAIRKTVEGIPEICDVHKIRTRFIGDSHLSVDLHIEVNGDMTVREGHDISTLTRDRILEDHMDIMDVIVHLEPCDQSGK